MTLSGYISLAIEREPGQPIEEAAESALKLCAPHSASEYVWLLSDEIAIKVRRGDRLDQIVGEFQARLRRGIP